MHRALPVVLFLISCGGKVASDGDPSASESPTPSEAPPEPAPSLPPSGGLVPPPSGSLPPKPDAATYTAYAWGGGLDHIDIFKADFAKDLCVHMHLASPVMAQPGSPYEAITTPADWAVRTADRSRGAAACKPMGTRKATEAEAGKGTVGWFPVAGQVLPCKLDVHAAVIFEGSKAAELFDADGVPVQGCM